MSEASAPGNRPRAEAGVSAREAEVLLAIAERLTNAEIAARLSISVRTVESHVSSLLRKLHAEDRRALAGCVAPPPRPASMPVVASAGTGSRPAALTPFVGRTVERAELAAAVRAHRLVSAVGPGGVGKSRLALAVLDDLAADFPDGAWFVDLSAVAEPDGIAPQLATVLGLGEHGDRAAEEAAAAWLARRRALIVLDSCEHLLDGVVALVERLLARRAGLRVLVTSRARLLVPFEWVVPVRGLRLDQPGAGRSDAEELFWQRAEAAGGALRASDTARVERICRDLEALPLALELAAARTASLGLDGVEANLADPVQLLAGGRRDNDRHSSIGASLDWSWALLGDHERAVLCRVAAFGEAFTAADATKLCVEASLVQIEDVATTLAALAEQSLLTSSGCASGTTYRLPEWVRRYAANRGDGAGEAGPADGDTHRRQDPCRPRIATRSPVSRGGHGCDQGPASRPLSADNDTAEEAASDDQPPHPRRSGRRAAGHVRRRGRSRPARAPGRDPPSPSSTPGHRCRPA